MHELLVRMAGPERPASASPIRAGASCESPLPTHGVAVDVEELEEAAFNEVLERLDTGVIVCDERGRVVLANDAARRELQRGRSLAIDAGGFLQLSKSGGTSSPQWRAALRAAVESKRRELIRLSGERDPLIASIAPLADRGRTWVLLLLSRRQLAPDLVVEMLGKLYELTQAERCVLAALLEGQRVEAVARQRGVKVSTLRTQVASLRAKFGVKRLEDLVRLVCGLPPIMGALRSPALRLCAAAARLTADSAPTAGSA